MTSLRLALQKKTFDVTNVDEGMLHFKLYPNSLFFYWFVYLV